MAGVEVNVKKVYAIKDAQNTDIVQMVPVLVHQDGMANIVH